MLKPCSLHKTEGFTFIEVLIALVIVAIALAAAISASSNATNNTSHLRDKTFAHWVASNRMAEIHTQHTFPSISSSESDTVEMGQIEWKWVQRVEKTPDDYIRRVIIDVYASNTEPDDVRPVSSLTTLVIAPELIDTNGNDNDS